TRPRPLARGGTGAVRSQSDCRAAGAPPRVLGELLQRRLDEGRPDSLTGMKSPQTTRRIIEALAGLYPGADTELHYRNAFELLVATMLSAQSTDARVNMVTPALFARYPGARALAAATPDEL